MSNFLKAATIIAPPVVRRPVSPRLSVPDSPQIRKTAQNFEDMAIAELLQPIFSTVKAEDTLFGGGVGESMWRPTLVEAVARHIGAHGGLGLAKPIYEHMIRMQVGQK